MIGQYTLDAEGNPVACEDMLEWARWYEGEQHRIVAQDDLPDGVRVSTVFLGIDYRFLGNGPPVLWETMIFHGPNAGYQERYTSLDDARAGHRHALSLARAPGAPAPEQP